MWNERFVAVALGALADLPALKRNLARRFVLRK
jgi:hypothetical protein